MRYTELTTLIAELTLKEKISLLVGTGMRMPGEPMDEANPDEVPGEAGTTHAIPRLGIPAAVMADGPAGLRIAPTRPGADRTYYATAFPVATAMAATWDTDLIQQVGQACGDETRRYGVDILLAPGMNLHRDPRGGRNFEYYSEDPLLSGTMAAAFVKGVESQGVGACLKHYVANNQETNRFLLDTLTDERTLRELYLRGFEIAMREAQPWTIMTSYNKINGTYVSQHHRLLTGILREEWGFEGFVMTDWFAGDDAVAQVRAGNDLLMPGTPDQYQVLLAAARSGELPEAVIDESVARILRVVQRTPSARGYQPTDDPDLEAHAELARRVAAQGIVLLQNGNDALPIADATAPLAAFGKSSYDFIAGGSGSGEVNGAYTVSLVEGLEAAGYRLHEATSVAYKQHIANEKAKQPERKSFMELMPPLLEKPITEQEVRTAAAATSAALITIGRNSGEHQDRELAGDYYLTDDEQNLIAMVSRVYRDAGKPVVAVLNVGNVIETASWREQVDAIVLAWQGGQEAGHAVADVLSGVVNPSGKLPTTFTIKYEDTPSASSFPGEEVPGEPIVINGTFPIGRPATVSYDEGIYVGYRHYVTREMPVAFPFGHGMSYTTFGYNEVQVEYADRMTASVRITNTGNRAGREVIQFYISAPTEDMDKPVRELKAYAKTRLLQPGESQVVEVAIAARDLASYDADRKAWVLAAGAYCLHAAASCMDVRASVGFEVGERQVW